MGVLENVLTQVAPVYFFGSVILGPGGSEWWSMTSAGSVFTEGALTWGGAAGTETAAGSPSARPLWCSFLLVAFGFSGS